MVRLHIRVEFRVGIKSYYERIKHKCEISGSNGAEDDDVLLGCDAV
jgi:hypothetical protein